MPDRKYIKGKNKVEEYYWGGKMVVYINNHSTEKTYKEACDQIDNKKINTD